MFLKYQEKRARIALMPMLGKCECSIVNRRCSCTMRFSNEKDFILRCVCYKSGYIDITYFKDFNSFEKSEIRMKVENLAMKMKVGRR